MNINRILRLFPYIEDKKRSEKLKIDKESISYISLREVANDITKIIINHISNINITPDNCIITDITAGVGGNAISFGMLLNKVNAIEIDELRYEYLINNINVYELKNISVYHDDCKNIMYKLDRQDVVFIDPPWGGKDYKQYNKLRLYLSDTPIEDICNNLFNKEITKHPPHLIVIKLPNNYDIAYLYDSVDSAKIYLHKLQKMLIISIFNTNTKEY